MLSSSNPSAVPEHPANKHIAITVNAAPSGSGEVVVALLQDGVPQVVPEDSEDAVPAGSFAEDASYGLRFTYAPAGEIGGGSFRIQIPTSRGWSVDEDVADQWDTALGLAGTVSLNDDKDELTAVFPEGFGESSDDRLELDLTLASAPDRRDEYPFTISSKNKSGTRFVGLTDQPEVTVGNTLADNDTVTVLIEPEAAYHGETDVRFDITLTANGPMHESEIQIEVPNGLADLDSLQMDTASAANYVSKVSPSTSSVEVTVPDYRTILIKTGKLNKDGKIKVRLDNVDITDDVDLTDSR